VAPGAAVRPAMGALLPPPGGSGAHADLVELLHVCLRGEPAARGSVRVLRYAGGAG